MEVFGKDKMSWSLGLFVVKGDVYLNAVDSCTGKSIAQLIKFKSDGTIITIQDAYTAIDSHGYNPYQHKNSFDKYGGINIKVVV